MQESRMVCEQGNIDPWAWRRSCMPALGSHNGHNSQLLCQTVAWHCRTSMLHTLSLLLFSRY